MSDDVAIRVKNLSKRYKLGQQTSGYKTLGETITRAVKSPFQRLQHLDSLEEKEEAGTFWALRDVSFEVRKGEVIGIIGRNGAGKSTLLKILSRITAPTEGTVEINGRIGSLLEVGTGFHPELTGRENVFLSGSIMGMKKAEIEEKFDQIVKFAEIEQFLDTPVKRYSSGMYVRLAFAVAAHLEPEILIVDEVLAVGDAAFQKKCLGKMGDVAEGGRTVLFVSHNMTAIRSLCKRGVLLTKGSILEEGDVDTVINKYLSKMSELTEQRWDDPATAPGNEMVKIHRAGIAIEGDSDQGIIRVDTPLRIEFEYWNYLDNALLNFSMHVFTIEGILVFNSTSEAEIQPKGLICGACKIPSNLLNDETYTIMIMIVKDMSKPLFHLDDALVFEVHDCERKSAWLGKFSGVVRPDLEWTTTHRNT